MDRRLSPQKRAARRLTLFWNGNDPIKADPESIIPASNHLWYGTVVKEVHPSGNLSLRPPQ